MRHESFVGVEKHQTFSETKTHNSAHQEENKQKQKILNKLSISLLELAVKLKSRRVLHFAIIALVVATMLMGSFNMPKQTGVAVKRSSTIAVNTNDQPTTLAAGAVLAENSKSLIAGDIKQKSNNLSNQITLETAGDDFLAKKQPVTTPGSLAGSVINYKVEDNDTLASLSEKFNITVDTILWANGIENEDSIKPGTDIVILPVSGVLHTVVDGDTLESITAYYRADIAAIDSFNVLGGELPSVGAKIVIPDGRKLSTAVSTSAAIAATRNIAFSLPGLSGPGGFGNSYSYGYCTWYVASRRAVPSNWGNAISWYNVAQRSGYGTGSTPRVGAIAWERKNHVAYVESVNGDGSVTVSEMNYGGGGGGWGKRSYRTTSASQFLYIY
ncbi:MAG: LysM peptidoglycan-binding domain-containing protein [bacterium]|nr:LysM peptidoglycan-binding domain-containing protein [bacterium]